MKYLLLLIFPLLLFSMEMDEMKFSSLSWELLGSKVILKNSNDSILYSDRINLGASHKIEKIESGKKKSLIVQTFENSELDFLYVAEFVHDTLIVKKQSFGMIRHLKNDIFYNVQIKSKNDNTWDSKLYSSPIMDNKHLLATLNCKNGQLTLKTKKTRSIKNEKLIFLNETELKKFWMENSGKN